MTTRVTPVSRPGGPTEGDQFDRIRLHQEIERARQLIRTYQEHMAFYQRKIEDNRYELGRLDERLGG